MCYKQMAAPFEKIAAVVENGWMLWLLLHLGPKNCNIKINLSLSVLL